MFFRTLLKTGFTVLNGGLAFLSLFLLYIGRHSMNPWILNSLLFLSGICFLMNLFYGLYETAQALKTAKRNKLQRKNQARFRNNETITLKDNKTLPLKVKA